MKAHIKAADGLDLGSILELTPPILLHLLDWFVKSKEGKVSGIWGNAGLSNVPGPREYLHLGNMPMSNWVSMGLLMHGLALNTTVWSYADKFNLCVLADSHLLPDGWEFIDYYRDAFSEYCELLDAGNHEPFEHILDRG
jgi:diacylglycerol O-acyltransferase